MKSQGGGVGGFVAQLIQMDSHSFVDSVWTELEASLSHILEWMVV